MSKDRLIPLNIPTYTGNEKDFLNESIRNRLFFYERHFTKKCVDWFSQMYPDAKLMVTNSCTHALEMAAIVAGIKAGDEVIMPSFTYVSTANAVVLRGAVPVFVDIRPDTLNINEALIEAAITPKTKAILPIHYSGVGAEMEVINEIARKHGLIVIEDAAHGIMGKYKNEWLGTFGDIACFSFDYMKNISCGEGGLIVINNPDFFAKADITYYNGTNRTQFLRGEIPNYHWSGMGSSFFPSDMNAAYLLAQLNEAENITKLRVSNWQKYYDDLKALEINGLISLPRVPDYCEQNSHIFYLICKNETERNDLIAFLKSRGITSAFHYIPLHSTEFGMKAGRFVGEDRYTTDISKRLIRLPIFHQIPADDIDYVVQRIYDFYKVAKH